MAKFKTGGADSKKVEAVRLNSTSEVSVECRMGRIRPGEFGRRRLQKWPAAGWYRFCGWLLLCAGLLSMAGARQVQAKQIRDGGGSPGGDNVTIKASLIINASQKSMYPIPRQITGKFCLQYSQSGRPCGFRLRLTADLDLRLL